ncbi:hypothetical protein I5Q34_26150 [Streptomyces sp. AV19]|uniref:hypothetical protein n=1 Tax=Streptomyces sp. AV19 TaxID=2793068 RepID=UPI0018FE4DC2|nr:hypothetical protein [Streptomyces sp. AV19]MBH1937712.1 hypothetical protein [Streptomyces sp. AV19]MDG4536380.1 hypothetical protein [Streptomyces sp. AV19]
MNEPANDPCLLDYAIISDPYPLYAATAANPTSTVHIVVSNGGGDTVYCREIIFSLPEGDLAQSLVVTGGGDGDGSVEGWTVEQLQKGASTVLPSGEYASFRVKPPADGTKVEGSGITITLRNLHIGTQPGTARVEIRETATKEVTQWPVNPRYRTLEITKFPPPELPFVGNFRAEPCDVELGKDKDSNKVRLMWDGPTDINYTVLYGAGAKRADDQKEDVVRGREWWGTVTRDTVFRLEYTAGGSTHYLTTGVTVANPRLTGLTVDGSASIAQDLTVGRDADVTGSLEATEDIATHGKFLDDKGTPLRGDLT